MQKIAKNNSFQRNIVKKLTINEKSGEKLHNLSCTKCKENNAHKYEFLN